MAKGDLVRVVYNLGERSEVIVVEAIQNGRTVTVERTKIDVEVTEKTRGGTIVRKVWLPLSAVLAIDAYGNVEEG